MSDLLLRGLGAKTVKRLKAQAKRNGRSVQKEAKLLVETGLQPDPAEIRDIWKRCDKILDGRKLSGSVEMIREDRNR